MRKIIALIIFCFTSQAFAENCPDISRLKEGLQQGWKIYDDENGTPLSQKQEAQFLRHAAQFVLAEWTNKKNNSAIHCYYNDKTGSHLEAYLAKENFTPLHSKTSYWYSVTGSMECAAGTSQCGFQKNISPQSQLAKN